MVTLVIVTLGSLFKVETDFIAKVLEQSKDDAAYQHLWRQVLDEIVR